MARRIPHILTKGNQSYRVNIPDLYDGIGSVVGVREASSSQAATANPAEVSQLVSSGIAVRMRVGSRSGTTGPLRYNLILVAADKIEEAFAQLVGKQISGRTIRSAKVPQRAVFR